jgi:hypothetical protein
VRARDNPAGLRFRELLRLAACFGIEQRRQSGSHIVLGADGLRRPLVVQDVRGQAKPYQVRQLVDAIDRLEDS